MGSEHPQRPSPPAAIFLVPVAWGWAGASSDLSCRPYGPCPDRTEGRDQVSALLGALWEPCGIWRPCEDWRDTEEKRVSAPFPPTRHVPPAHPPPQSLPCVCFQGLLLGWGAGERRRAEPDGSLPEDCWGRGGPVPSLSSV